MKEIGGGTMKKGQSNDWHGGNLTAVSNVNTKTRRSTVSSRHLLVCIVAVIILVNLLILWSFHSATYSADINDDFYENVEDIEATSQIKGKVEGFQFGDVEENDNRKKTISVPPITNESSNNTPDSISNVEICDKRIHIAIVSDREKSDYPLKALINSILNFTSTPVTVNIVTKNRIPFMDMLNTTSYFSVHYHDSTHLFESSQKLIQETGFKTLHYSAKFGMQKLFLSKLQFATTTQKIIVLDDDITFFTDITPLWETIMENPRNISLYCPEDAGRVKRYFVQKNARDNGHSLRYCNSGLMGIPLASNFTKLAIEATQKMTKQYDFSYSVADQDIVNRMLAENNNGYEFIPCQWACDVNSCFGLAPNRGKCSTCQKKRCYAYHWLHRRYEINDGNRWGKPEYNFKWYYLKNSTELLNTIFVPRVAANCEINGL